MADNSNLIRNFLFSSTIKEPTGTRLKLDYMQASFNSPKYRMSRYITSSIVVMITAQYRCSPDLISEDFYGTPDLWWVIARYNGIGNPMHPVNGLVPGRRIFVPNLADVKQWLQACRSTSQSVSADSVFLTI